MAYLLLLYPSGIEKREGSFSLELKDGKNLNLYKRQHILKRER
jgi:hypothetical protein